MAMSAVPGASISGAVEVFKAQTSFAQQRLWFLDQYDPGTGLYNIPAAWRISGNLNRIALERSLNEVVRRHEVLRTTFALDANVPQQVVAERLWLDLVLLDLSALADTEVRAQQLIADEAAAAFDLARGPLIRAMLIKIAADEHYLLLTVHHIVSDGWSTGVLMRELSALYRAYAIGQRSPLSGLPLQYADFALWQREWLHGDALQEQLDYWRRALDSAPPALELPTDRPRPASLSHRGATLNVDFSPQLSANLRSLCRRSQVTLFIGLAAAFNVLLWRHSGQDDICIGYPVANRNRPEIEDLIGFFVNTLVLRTRLSPEQTFEALLEQVRELVLDADAHQDLPFEKLVEELRPVRNPARSPLFQVMLALNNTGASGLELPGLVIRSMESASDIAKFELSLGVVERNGCLHLAFNYNIDLFDAATIARMAGHYRALLEAAVANPQTRIDALPLLTADERRQLLVAWNDTAAEFPQDQCIHTLFEQQVIRNPNAPAVIFEDRQLSYEALNHKSNQLAHQLLSLGVKPGTRIAVCAERSPEMVVGVLGILKAGAAYVPLDPGWPAARHERLLRALATPIVVTTQAQLQKMQSVAQAADSVRSICCLDGAAVSSVVDADGPIASRPYAESSVLWPASTATHARDNPALPVAATDVAYIIFTSGSTGEPKGVVLTHRPVVNLIAWVNRRIGVGPSDRLLFVTSLCFDLSVYDLLGTLAAGAVIDIVPERVLEEPSEFAAYVRTRPITFWDSAPASLRFLTQFMVAGDNGVAASTLRVVFLSGDWIALDLPERIRELFPSAQLVALGGATEAAIWSNYFMVGSVGAHWRSIPYGKPIDNARYYILDDRLQPLPIGVAGDLYIGGGCLASGYVGDPMQTAERFLPDPYDSSPGRRMYRTGDSARFMPDGNIEFLGRRDQQVKIRGFRIELGEVESALLQCAGVREAVVIARKDDADDKRLVAYVVAADETSLTVGELRARLQTTLPEYMVPSAYVFLDALPLTSNGKIDRLRLPAPDSARGNLGVVYVAPRTPAEALLAEIWAEALKVDRVGVHDNFFELGGYSLMIVQVVALLRDRHHCHITVRDVFGTRDLEELAQRIARGGSSLAVADASGVLQPAPPSARSTIPRTLGPQAYLASHRVADEVCWNARHLDSRMSWFQYQFTIHIHASLASSSIKHALRSVVARHPVLASRFSLAGDSVWMHEGDFDDLEFESATVDAAAGTDPLAAARTMLLRSERRPFDRLQGPLCRFKLIALPAGDNVLSVQLDHALFDLQSQDVVLSDFADALRPDYRAETLSIERRDPLYSDYCRWHRSVLTDDYWKRLQDYWARQFPAPIDPYGAVFGAPDADPAVPKWQQHRWVLDAQQSSRVNAICVTLGVTPLVLFMGFFRWWALHERRVAVFELETDVLGRVNPQFNRTVGFFSTNLVLRFASDARMTLRAVIADTAGVFADGLAHQELPFFALKQIANPALTAANFHWPIKFSQQTTVLDNASRAASMREFTPLQLGIAGGGAHPLCIYLTGGPKNWNLDYLYDATVVSRHTITALAQAWQSLLQSFR